MTPPEERHRYLELIGAFLLGKLDGVELTAMQTHLDSCPVCQEEVRELEPVVAALADATPGRTDKPPEPPEDLEEQTLAPILGEIYRARRRRGRLQGSALAAAAICVVVIGLAGFVGLLEPALTLELREDAVSLEVRMPGGDLVFSAKLTGASGPKSTEGPSAEKSDPADTQKKPKDASSGGGTPPKESSPEIDPKRPSPGGASSASPDPDAAPGAGGQKSLPPDAGQESVPPDAGQGSASPAAGKQAAPASASPAADQYYAQP